MFPKTTAELVKNTSTVSPTTLPTVKDALDNLQGRAPTSLPVPVTEGGTGLTSVGSSGTVLGSTGTALNYVAARELLTAGRTYYVRTDGSDSNNGLTNNSAGAFLTIQKAIDVVSGLDLAGFSVTIQVGSGTYTAGASVARPFLGGSVTLQGDTTTPSNVTISTTGACINVVGGAALSVAGFKLVSSAGDGIVADSGNVVVSGQMEYGACAGAAHIRTLTGGRATTTSNYTISGNSPRHLYADGTGSAIVNALNTVTLTGTPAFSVAFANIVSCASLTAFGQTYSGAATGTRYSAQINAAINTGGGGASYFPGNAAGSATSGAQYV